MAEITVTTATTSVSVIEGDVNEATLVAPASVAIELSASGPQGPIGPLSDIPKSATIANPQVGDSFVLLRTSRQTIITELVSLVSGTSPVISYELRFSGNRSSAGLVAASGIATSKTLGDAGIIVNGTIPGSNFIWLNITAVSGVANDFSLSMVYF